MCNSEIIPLVLPRERLEQELKERKVFFQQSDSREMLVHTLEMDILFRSQRLFSLFKSRIGVKGSYQDYGVHRVTAFDIFNADYGTYTGPMLSALLKEKGITPPR